MPLERIISHFQTESDTIDSLARGKIIYANNTIHPSINALGRDKPSNIKCKYYYIVTSLLAYNVGQHGRAYIEKSVYKLLG